MKTKPVISRITIYPIKSLDGVSLQKAKISEGGCLLHDREYAMTDEQGNYINGKSNALVHSLRTEFDMENETISFCRVNENSLTQFHLQKERSEIESYLSEYFGKKTFLKQNKTGRFLDIPDIGGATVLSTSSLMEVSKWYDNMDMENTRKRFRASIEIEGVPAFWEDRLFSSNGNSIEFKACDVTFYGIEPRVRCVVPSRNPETGEVTHAFQKTFAKHRATMLPEWSALSEFDHYYFLSVDCLIPATEVGKIVKVGSEIEIFGDRAL